MKWTPLSFGKHEGKTLPQVLFKDPDWFFWAYKNRKFDEYQNSLKNEVNKIHNRACNIRIPKPDENNYEIEHFIDPRTYKYAYFKIVPADQGKHVGSSHTIRSKVIDMSIPRLYVEKDKKGNKYLVDGIKLYFFGDESYKMTKKRCEEFFNDDSNFRI